MLREKDSGTNYAKQKPCSTVDRLVEELEHLAVLLLIARRVQTNQQPN